MHSFGFLLLIEPLFGEYIVSLLFANHNDENAQNVFRKYTQLTPLTNRPPPAL